KEKRSLSTLFHLRLREASLIMTGALALFLLLALFTYSPSDPAWNHILHLHKETINAGGKVGAFISSSFIHLFGYFAFLLPFLLFYSVWLYFHLREALDSDYLSYFTMLKSIGLLLLLIPGCALASLHWQIDWAPKISGGGFIGLHIAKSMLNLFNFSGTNLIL